MLLAGATTKAMRAGMTAFVPNLPKCLSRRAIATTIAVILLAAALPFVAAVAAQERRLPRAPASQGDKIFESNCSVCHGMDGRGGVHAPNIATDRAVTQLSDAALRRIVEDGISSAGMPSFKALGHEKINLVVGYLRTLQGVRPDVPVTGNPARGKMLFYGQALCASCHMVHGKGGFLGPDLTDYAHAHSHAEITEAIVNPDKNMSFAEERVVAVTRDGKTFAGIARNEDNFSLQMQTPDGRFHLFMKSELASLRHLPGSLMPDDYSRRLSPEQIDDLASFLEAAGEHVPTGGKNETLRRLPKPRRKKFLLSFRVLNGAAVHPY
ncbi:MAG: c-type cytochrome [Acidobacteriota bacterium]|nr:c-type cytochrome [Acidobacteriota bacterium]